MKIMNSKREGAAKIAMIVEPLGGRREVLIRDDHSGNTWANNMAYIAEEMYRIGGPTRCNQNYRGRGQS
jgi:hypothetical protein